MVFTWKEVKIQVLDGTELMKDDMGLYGPEGLPHNLIATSFAVRARRLVGVRLSDEEKGMMQRYVQSRVLLSGLAMAENRSDEDETVSFLQATSAAHLLCQAGEVEVCFRPSSGDREWWTTQCREIDYQFKNREILEAVCERAMDAVAVAEAWNLPEFKETVFQSVLRMSKLFGDYSVNGVLTGVLVFCGRAAEVPMSHYEMLYNVEASGQGIEKLRSWDFGRGVMMLVMRGLELYPEETVWETANLVATRTLRFLNDIEWWNLSAKELYLATEAWLMATKVTTGVYPDDAWIDPSPWGLYPERSTMK